MPRARYPWSVWEDGEVHAVDTETPERLAGVLRTRAARRGLRVHQRKTSTGLTFQFLAPDADPAPVFARPSPPHDPGNPACPTCGRAIRPPTAA